MAFNGVDGTNPSHSHAYFPLTRYPQIQWHTLLSVHMYTVQYRSRHDSGNVEFVNVIVTGFEPHAKKLLLALKGQDDNQRKS